MCTCLMTPLLTCSPSVNQRVRVSVFTNLPNTIFRTPDNEGVASFTNHDSTLWFTILECNFKVYRVSSSLTKFSHPTTLLPHDILSQVSETIFKAATSDSPYEDFKAAVLS